jgi:hypothetical protein
MRHSTSVRPTRVAALPNLRWGFGNCDDRKLDRLKRECLRDSGEQP